MNRSVLIAIVIMALTLAGCAGKKTPTFHAHYYPECYDPIDRLCKDQSKSSEVKGAAAGALLGAIGGAIIGGLATGKVQGALVGGAAGALAGGAIGYYKAHLDKIKDRDQRLAEYQKLLGESSRSWDIERASVEKAYSCYREQIRLLKKQVVNKSISREEFLARMNEIQSGLNNINEYWADAQTRMDARIADGESFLKRQELEDQKLAQQKRLQAQRQLQAQRKRTADQRAKKNSDVANLNSLKNSTTTEFQDLKKYLGVSKTLA